MKSQMTRDDSCDQRQHVTARDISDSGHESLCSARSERSVHAPVVVIVGPPWPRSGTARVIQNQIDHYRARGFCTIFVAVPFHWVYTRSSPIWDQIDEGIREMGADKVFLAPLEERRYHAAKYTASIRHLFQGTTLDWTIAIGRSARLPVDLIQCLADVPVTLLHVNYVQTLGFALRLRKKLAGQGVRLPIILETHDIQSHLLHERHDLNPWTHKPDRLEDLIHSEISFLQNVDVLVHLSVDDFEFFQTQMRDKSHVLALPTISEKYISDVQAAAASTPIIDLLFVGQNHAPNVAAMQWFFEQAWPFLLGRAYNLKIVGAVDLLVRERFPQIYEAFRPCFVGPVADLTVYYSSARCVIAPMVSGSGTSIKTIEALALGKPFVGTSKAFRGMPMDRINAVGIRSYDSPQAFADAIVRTLSDEQQARAKSRAVYDCVFSRQASFAARDEALRVATNKKQ